MKRILLALLLALAPASAWAQSARDFPTPNLGERVPLMVFGCLNAQGYAVPATAAGTCLGSGGGASTVGISQTTPGSTNGTTSVGNSNIATAQVSVAATATQVVAARAGRGAVTIENTGTTAAYCGASGVTATTGMPLPGVVGASLTIPTSAAVYCITASGTQTVGELETY